MENISHFLDGARNELNVATHELFQTTDLYENSNMTQVLYGITAVARHVSVKLHFPDYKGLFNSISF